MLRYRSESHSRDTLSIVRDVVEVVAICLAGLWAFYVFIYEERIKPASETPQIVLTGDLVRAGERHGLLAFRYRVTVHNSGHARVNIIGTGFAANGVRFTTSGTPFSRMTTSGGAHSYARDARVASRTLIYYTFGLTRFAKPEYGGGYSIEPGQEVPYSGIVLVRRKDFDAVYLDASVAFARYDREFPTLAGVNKFGGVIFKSANKDPAFNNFEATLAREMLW